MPIDDKDYDTSPTWQLQQICRDRGLSILGKKEDLIIRLMTNDLKNNNGSIACINHVIPKTLRLLASSPIYKPKQQTTPDIIIKAQSPSKKITELRSLFKLLNNGIDIRCITLHNISTKSYGRVFMEKDEILMATALINTNCLEFIELDIDHRNEIIFFGLHHNHSISRLNIEAASIPTTMFIPKNVSTLTITAKNDVNGRPLTIEAITSISENLKIKGVLEKLIIDKDALYDDVHMEALSMLVATNDVQSFKLTCNVGLPMTDHAVSNICSSNLVELEIEDFDANIYTSEIVCKLAYGLVNNKKLLSISLKPHLAMPMRIPHVGTAFAYLMKNNNTLLSLNTSGFIFTDVIGHKMVDALRSNRILKYLDLSKNCFSVDILLMFANVLIHTNLKHVVLDTVGIVVASGCENVSKDNSEENVNDINNVEYAFAELFSDHNNLKHDIQHFSLSGNHFSNGHVMRSMIGNITLNTLLLQDNDYDDTVLENIINIVKYNTTLRNFNINGHCMTVTAVRTIIDAIEKYNSTLVNCFIRGRLANSTEHMCYIEIGLRLKNILERNRYNSYILSRSLTKMLLNML